MKQEFLPPFANQTKVFESFRPSARRPDCLAQAIEAHAEAGFPTYDPGRASLYKLLGRFLGLQLESTKKYISTLLSIQ